MKGNAEKNNSNYKNTFLYLTLLLILPFINGCYGITELDDRVIVSLVGLDQLENGNVEVTMGLIDTRLIELQEAESLHVYTFEGETIFDAVRMAILEIGKQPMWPYIKAVVFGPSFKENDVKPYLDFFNRNNEVQPNHFIVFSDKPAREIVEIRSDLANIPAVTVEQQIEHQALVSYSPEVRLHHFTEMMFSQGQVGYASIIKREEDENVHKIEGTALIKEGKWIGTLNRMETRGALWVQGAVKGGITVVPFKNGKLSLEIVEETGAAITPILKDNKLTVKVDIQAFASLGEMMTVIESDCGEIIAEINRSAEQEIVKEIEASLKKTQGLGTDIYGIGRIVHREFPKYWKKNKENWSEIFSDLPIEINVTVEMIKMGLFNNF
ncbi:hypothetical protein BKP37_16270 [Anaerobacillus alkalilacustris]|uniref:Uncharacterized protein n=1 Tax=Anaerobacillus alkalilacustris TaxID=393763 RepID=A0A1S2LFR4_9BACI|nr:Ger(x)C family spore germination protein [Anaerobacillus alkalilacustris]OIJ11206.1 hypothetical protein BKP37_16270 [Anaerobacillus alkalilacustris]